MDTARIAFAGTPAVNVGTVLTDRQPAVADDRTLYDGITALIQNRPALKESLATRLSDELNTTMYGRGIQDTIAPETHEHDTMYTSPYARPGAGAASFVTYTDTNSGQVYVLLGLKPEGDLVPPGGYMEVHEPEGGKEGKKSDRNLMETSRRELEEETGLDIDAAYKPESLGTCSDYGISNDPRLHTVLEGFHYNLGGAGPPPQLKGRDDLQSAIWVKADDILVAPAGNPQQHGSKATRFMVPVGEGHLMPIRDHYGEHILRAIDKAHQSAQTPDTRIHTENVVLQSPTLTPKQAVQSWTEKLGNTPDTGGHTLH